jgi:hypothetical protein
VGCRGRAVWQAPGDAVKTRFRGFFLMVAFAKDANAVSPLAQPARGGQKGIQVSRVAPGREQEVQWHSHCADETVNGGLKPDQRDALLDALGRHFTDQPCPRSYGMDAAKWFMADLQNAMISTKWKVELKGFGMIGACAVEHNEFGIKRADCSSIFG